MTGFTPKEWRTAARVARRSIFTEGNPDLADAWEKAADQVEARLIPAGGMALTAEQVEDVEALVATANPYSAPAARLRALFPATEPAAERCQKWTVRVAGGIETGIQCVLPAGHECFHDYVPPAPAEPAEAHCTVPPEGWWCSRAANHDGPCAASEGVAPWVPQPLEADWLDQVDPRDPQSRTHRETAAAKFAEPAEEETKAVTFDEIAQSLKSIGDAESSFGFDLRFWRRIAEKLIAKYPHLASSPVVPAPTETEAGHA